MKKVLEAVSPWNDVYYKDCSYNCLFAGVEYFNGSINPFLVDDFFTYSYSEPIIKSSNIMNHSFVDLAKKTGIEVKQFQDFRVEDEFVDCIKTCIQNEQTVYIPIDRYYWEGTPGVEENIFYKNRNYGHAFLVYGFDDDKNLFNILDITDKTKRCYKAEIKYDNLFEAFVGYCDMRINDPKRYFFLSLGKAHKVSAKEYTKENYIKNYFSNKSKVIKGLDCINDAINDLDDFLVNPERALSISALDLSMAYHFIESANEVRQYQYEKLFGLDARLHHLINEIKETNKTISIIFLKFVMQKKVTEKSINIIKYKYNEIFEKEIESYQLFEQMI